MILYQCASGMKYILHTICSLLLLFLFPIYIIPKEEDILRNTLEIQCVKGNPTFNQHPSEKATLRKNRMVLNLGEMQLESNKLLAN